jgi:putative endonuclease
MFGRLIARLHEALGRPFAPRSLGARGEAAAARYLRRQGYVIVARGAQTGGGEIDLIAVDRRAQPRTLVFVEVKTRTSHDAGHPAAAVDQRKQVQISRLAAIYLRQHDLVDCRTRFDVVAVTWPPNVRRPTIEHIADAFDAQSSRNMLM